MELQQFEILEPKQVFEFSLSLSEENGVAMLHINADAKEGEQLCDFTVRTHYPAVKIHSKWTSGAGFRRGVIPDWYKSEASCATSNSPIAVLLDYSGINQITIAFSDGLNKVKMLAGVNEDLALITCGVSVKLEVPVSHYEAVFRLDLRKIPFEKAIESVAKWWEALPGYLPAPVPEHAVCPMYSTWYSFHQALSPDDVVEECKLAKQLGCETVIVDDGWQTEGDQRGYGHCGDWAPAESKIPSMREFVGNVHRAGMKFMLWYSVPYIGKYSKAWSEFENMTLDNLEGDWRVLDPRFPQVREYLIELYKKAVFEWELDGFKLDFVDSFTMPEGYADHPDSRRDYVSVQEAADQLLKDVICELRKIKPDILIEFRQSYTGPLMRTYGNMLRAADCPNDSLSNRLRTIDLRLISRNTAVHSDMLMWNFKETAAQAALQLIHVLFSVPQISIRLEKAPEDHIKMLKFYLGFWRENREVLLGGKLHVQMPEANYTAVTADTKKRCVSATYGGIIDLNGQGKEKMVFVNGTLQESVFIRNMEDNLSLAYQVQDCCGDVVKEGKRAIPKGISEWVVPAAGILTMRHLKA